MTNFHRKFDTTPYYKPTRSASIFHHIVLIALKWRKPYSAQFAQSDEKHASTLRGITLISVISKYGTYTTHFHQRTHAYPGHHMHVNVAFFGFSCFHPNKNALFHQENYIVFLH